MGALAAPYRLNWRALHWCARQDSNLRPTDSQSRKMTNDYMNLPNQGVEIQGFYKLEHIHEKSPFFRPGGANLEQKNGPKMPLKCPPNGYKISCLFKCKQRRLSQARVSIITTIIRRPSPNSLLSAFFLLPPALKIFHGQAGQ